MWDEVKGLGRALIAPQIHSNTVGYYTMQYNGHAGREVYRAPTLLTHLALALLVTLATTLQKLS